MSTCAVLSEQGCRLAVRTYRAWKQGLEPSARTVSDAHVIHALRATKGEAESLHGRRKMVAHLRRQGLAVAHCTVDRLMRTEGVNGAHRARSHRTTVPGKDGKRAGDLLNRKFVASEPDLGRRLRACEDLAGFGYVASVVDVFAQRMVGWHAMTTKHTDLVLTCLRMATWRRDHDGRPADGGLIHHSDAGSQYTSPHFTEHLVIEDIAPSSGSVGDAYDNAPTETVIGPCKTECIRPGPFRDGPLKTPADVEYATAAWVEWWNDEPFSVAVTLEA